MVSACAAQLRWTGGQVSAPAGLDYVAVDIVRRACRVKSTEDFWQRVAVVEAEIVEIYGRKLKQAMKHG